MNNISENNSTRTLRVRQFEFERESYDGCDYFIGRNWLFWFRNVGRWQATFSYKWNTDHFFSDSVHETIVLINRQFRYIDHQFGNLFQRNSFIIDLHLVDIY